MFDGKAMAAEVLNTVRGFVSKSLEPYDKRIDALEKRAPPKDGKDADPVNYEQIAAGCRNLVADAVAKIPVAKDGKDVDPEVMRAEIRVAISDLAECYAKGLEDAA